MTITKFDIEMLDVHINFSLWEKIITDILIQYDLETTLEAKMDIVSGRLEET